MNLIALDARNPGPWTGEGNTTYLVGGTVLIDAGVGDPGHLDALSRALASSVLHVLVTHGHPDHITGVEAIAARWPFATFSKLPWPEADLDHQVPWRPLADGDVIEAGGHRLITVHTPGHSPDHVCFYEPNARTLFSGDLLRLGGSVVIPASRGGDLVAYLGSLDRLLALDPARAYPAHGPVIEDLPALVRGYRAHRAEREEQVLGALSAGRFTPLETLFERVYGTTVPEALGGAARETLLAHLQKLEREGRVEGTAQGWILRV